MGYTIHHSIVVTSSIEELLVEAHTYACQTGASVSPIIPGVTNGVASFLVASDGSKEGWPDSQLGDARREAIKAFLESKAYGDGSNSLRWFEVSFPEDEPAQVVAHSYKKMRG